MRQLRAAQEMVIVDRKLYAMRGVYVLRFTDAKKQPAWRFSESSLETSTESFKGTTLQFHHSILDEYNYGASLQLADSNFQ
jgi:hypothetical protein